MAWALAAAVAAPPAGASATAWLGADGKPLPFSAEEEILEFLASAEVVASKVLSTGTSRPRKLTLRRDGIEAHAVFHDIHHVEEMKSRRLRPGSRVLFFRDTYHGQIAAYRISRLLGLDSVPPTVERLHAGTRGSAQLWIEGSITEHDRLEQRLPPPDVVRWDRQISDMRVFDNLINNIDRNQGNMLIDARGRVWLIDHTRSFGRDKSLPRAGALSRCSHRLWEGLRSLDQEALDHRLGDLLSAYEIRAILARRDLLVEWITKRIARLGEERVLFADEP